MSRLDNTGDESDVLFEARGGTSIVDNIRPDDNNSGKIGDVLKKYEAIYVQYINSEASHTQKIRPLGFVREGTFTLPNFSGADQLHTVTFSNVGTSSYKVIGSLRGTSSSTFSSRNDCIFTIFDNFINSSVKLSHYTFSRCFFD